MPRLPLHVISFLAISTVVGVPSIGGADTAGPQVTLVNDVTKSEVCTAEAKTLTVFLTAGDQRDLAPGDSTTFQAPSLFGKYQFGLQENSWFWIPVADPNHQDPDNAGMQVIIDDVATCALSTAASLAGPDTPDARKVIQVAGKSSGAGQCTVTVSRLSPPTLYPTRECCAPPAFSPSCQSLGIPRGQNSDRP